MYKYAIIGFGGLGKMHLCNLKKLENERKDLKLAAICGTTREEAQKNVTINLGMADVSKFDFSECNFYQDYKKMIETEELDFVLSVLPSFMHEEVAVYCMEHGIHVFSEKPMALTLKECNNMVNVARKNRRKLMIGQCLRFHPAYCKLKEYIESGAFGRVRRAEFNRYSQMPLWTWNNWILDDEKSGGCVLDMHIHDVDLINWYFGIPESLQSVMTDGKIKKESIATHYFYNGFIVTSQADWALPQTFPFIAQCRVDFEKASVTIKNDELIIYTDDRCIRPEISSEDAFFEEEKAFLNLVIENKPCKNTSMQSTYQSVEIVMKEIESAQSGKRIYLK